MGYYSEVVLAMHQDLVTQELLDVLNKVPPDIMRERDNAILFRWEMVKWYSLTDPDVKAIEDYIRALDEEKLCFIRLGESVEDVEEFGYPEDFGLEVYSETKIIER